MWLYKEKEINKIADLPEGTFGFVYCTTHTPTGKKYIGKKSLIYNLKKRLGKKELTYLECKYQFMLEVLENTKYLNDNILGKFFDKDFK